jgi:hypothetical protein
MDKESSLLRHSASCIDPQTEGFAVTVQDPVIKTRDYEKHCLGVEVISRCRKCDEMGETIEHVIAGCSSSESAYLGRQNQLAKIIHKLSVKKYKLLDIDTPPTVAGIS